LPLDLLVLISDRVRYVVDAGDFEQIQVAGHVVFTRHALAIESELACATAVIFLAFIARNSCACPLIDLAEQGDPFSIKLILNIERALDVLHIGQLRDC